MATKLTKTEFPMLRRLGRDLDWFFDRFGFDRPMFEPAGAAWAPDLEIVERGNEITIRAELPGLKREEVIVEVTDAELTIKGERTREQEEKGEGFFRSERSYGSFSRTVALPEGVKADAAKAILKDGVLEVKIPIARVEAKRRTLEIAEPPAAEKVRSTPPDQAISAKLHFGHGFEETGPDLGSQTMPARDRQ